MITDFKDNSFYEYAINLKKYYHAYLFEVDDIPINYPLILAFAKMIICRNHYIDNSKCGDCNICHLIDNNTYSDLKIVEPDGASIKKEQVLNLQKELSLKSVSGNNQVYIIKEADKMNPSASNSLLKFIEEPEEGIYGILITTNRKALLETILSRCVLITLKSNKNNGIELESEDIEQLSNFLSTVFRLKKESFPYVKRDFLIYYATRDDIIKAFGIMEIILDYLIKDNYKINVLENSIYDIIKRNLPGVSINNIVNCLDKIVFYKNKLMCVVNLNINLFMDRFIIDVSEVLK